MGEISMSIEALYGLHTILPNRSYRVPTDQGVVSLRSAKGIPKLTMSKNWRQRQSTNRRFSCMITGVTVKGSEHGWFLGLHQNGGARKGKQQKLFEPGLDQHEGYGRGWKRREMRS